MTDEPESTSLSLPSFVRQSVEDGERLTIQAGTDVEGEFNYMAVLQECEAHGFGPTLGAALADLNQALQTREPSTESKRLPRLGSRPLPSRPAPSKPKNAIESFLEDVADDSWDAGNS